PAEPGVARQCALEHRRRIDEHAMAEGTDAFGHLGRQALQALAHELVVVAPQRVARHVGALAVGQRAPGLVGILAVVQADGNHADGARNQFRRARALQAMPGHPVHVAVQAARQPVVQVGFVAGEVDAGNAAALETRVARERADRLRQGVEVGSGGAGSGNGHRASIESGPMDALHGQRGTPLHDAAALRAVEAEMAARPGDGFGLMARAGQAAWRELLARWPGVQRIAVVCGPGNNGGDGYELCRHAHESGRDARVLRIDAHVPRTPLAQRACEAYLDAGGRIAAVGDGFGGAQLVVDALFGIGLARAPDEAAAAVIDAINASGLPVFALDVPS